MSHLKTLDASSMAFGRSQSAFTPVIVTVANGIQPVECTGRSNGKIQQALSNSKEIVNSPDLKSEIVNAVMVALDAHNSLSTQH
jgi:hypothetical protein